jgi:hypothetical protein
VVITTAAHAFALIGYQRTLRQDGTSWVRFVRHDDLLGPYRTVDNCLADVDPVTGTQYGPWFSLLAPVPDGLWLLPEAAETFGTAFLLEKEVPESVRQLDRAGRFALHTVALRSRDLLAGLPDRGYSPEAVDLYRATGMPPWIWVTELVDRSLRDQGEPCVIGELVVDPTTPDVDPGAILRRVENDLWVFEPPEWYAVQLPDRAVRML